MTATVWAAASFEFDNSSCVDMRDIISACSRTTPLASSVAVFPLWLWFVQHVRGGSARLLLSQRAIRRRVSRYSRVLRYVKTAIALGLLSSVFAYLSKIWSRKVSILPFGYQLCAGNRLTDKKKAVEWNLERCIQSENNDSNYARLHTRMKAETQK